MGSGGSFTCLWEPSKGRMVGSAMMASYVGDNFALFVQSGQRRESPLKDYQSESLRVHKVRIRVYRATAAGESESNLRKAFEEAEKNSPAIIFIGRLVTSLSSILLRG